MSIKYKLNVDDEYSLFIDGHCIGSVKTENIALLIKLRFNGFSTHTELEKDIRNELQQMED